MKKLSKSATQFILPLSMLFFMNCGRSVQNETRVDALPYYEEATFTPQWLDPNDEEALAQFHRISPFHLINQDGDSISDQTFDGKIYVTDFFFTICPGICPKLTKNMALLQEEFLDDEDVLLLSHSVTPERDSVPVLKAYAEKKGIQSDKWHLATGDQKQIYQLGRSEYFVEEDLGLEKSEDEFLHTENFVLIDKQKHIRGIYNGLNKTAVDQLITDLRTLQREL